MLKYLQSSMAIYGPRGPGYAHQQYKPYHIQDLQYFKDKTSEVVMVLQSNVDVMTALRRYYVGLKTNKDFALTDACQENIDSFAADLDVIIDELKMHISRAKLLAGTISDRKELVSF